MYPANGWRAKLARFVGEATVTWDQRNKRIFDAWMACYAQEEIAAALDCERHDVDNCLRKSAELPDYAKAASEHATDFTPPLHNEWKQHLKPGGR